MTEFLAYTLVDKRYGLVAEFWRNHPVELPYRQDVFFFFNVFYFFLYAIEQSQRHNISQRVVCKGKDSKSLFDSQK